MSKKKESAKQRQQRVRGKRINKRTEMFMKALDQHMFYERMKERMKIMQGEKDLT